MITHVVWITFRLTGIMTVIKCVMFILSQKPYRFFCTSIWSIGKKKSSEKNVHRSWCDQEFQMINSMFLTSRGVFQCLRRKKHNQLVEVTPINISSNHFQKRLQSFKIHFESIQGYFLGNDSQPKVKSGFKVRSTIQRLLKLNHNHIEWLDANRSILVYKKPLDWCCEFSEELMDGSKTQQIAQKSSTLWNSIILCVCMPNKNTKAAIICSFFLYLWFSWFSIKTQNTHFACSLRIPTKRYEMTREKSTDHLEILECNFFAVLPFSISIDREVHTLTLLNFNRISGFHLLLKNKKKPGWLLTISLRVCGKQNFLSAANSNLMKSVRNFQKLIATLWYYFISLCWL